MINDTNKNIKIFDSGSDVRQDIPAGIFPVHIFAVEIIMNFKFPKCRYGKTTKVKAKPVSGK